MGAARCSTARRCQCLSVYVCPSLLIITSCDRLPRYRDTQHPVLACSRYALNIASLSEPIISGSQYFPDISKSITPRQCTKAQGVPGPVDLMPVDTRFYPNVPFRQTRQRPAVPWSKFSWIYPRWVILLLKRHSASYDPLLRSLDWWKRSGRPFCRAIGARMLSPQLIAELLAAHATNAAIAASLPPSRLPSEHSATHPVCREFIHVNAYNLQL